jgi:hypothetical protein
MFRTSSVLEYASHPRNRLCFAASAVRMSGDVTCTVALVMRVSTCALPALQNAKRVPDAVDFRCELRTRLRYVLDILKRRYRSHPK